MKAFFTSNHAHQFNPLASRLIMIVFMMAYACIVQAQSSGYIYLHKKALDEGSSPNFNFSLTGGGSSFGTLTVNDKADVIDAYDLGASHGTSGSNSGNGQLWAVTGSDNTGNPHDAEGTIYMRAAGTAAWVSTGVSGKSVDGAAYNQVVRITAANKAYLYTFGGSDNQIYDPANHSGVNLRDIAWGGGTTVAVDANGNVIKYTGTYANNSDSWINLSTASGLTADIRVIDIVPSTQQIVVQADNGTVYTMNSNGTGLATLSFPTNGGDPQQAEIAVDDNGNIYAVFKETVIFNEGDFVFSYNSATSSWTFEPQTRELKGLTAGVGGQVWGTNTLGGTARNSIYSRTTEGGMNWLDDERVRTSFVSNSMMIPIQPGTYTLAETVPAGWDINEIKVYDPTTNSTVDAAGSKATIRVAAGEVVHVLFTNQLITTTTISNSCTLQYVQNFGSGTPQFGNAFTGTTPYHYVASTRPQDGYYTLEKDVTDWFTPGSEITADHTPDAIDGGNGYLLVVNASYGKDEFYRQRVTGLVVGQQYQISFWAANVSPDNPIQPNVLFGIANVNTGNFIGSVNTGDITSTTWQQYSFAFTAPTTTADLVFRNNSIGGEGNDIAIDDITLNAAPPMVSAINGPSVACSNTGATYTFTNTTAGGAWSVSPASRATINASTGVLTPVANATGQATVTYSVTSAGGCVSTATKDITINNMCAGAPVSIAGNVFNDANGLNDNTVNGPGTNAGGLNVIVYNNTTGKIQAITALPSSGVYSFSGLPGGDDYSVVITTNTATAGNTAPIPTVALPASWTTTGEHVGTTAGSDGNPDGILTLGVLSANVAQVNFGIERLPTADNKTGTNQANPGGMNRAPTPTLTGSDPEDGIYTGVSLTNTIIINSLPSAATGTLYYNGALVTAGQTILGYDPSLLTIDPADGAVTPSFTYRQVDAAGKASAPATVTVPFIVAPDLTPIIFARPSTQYGTTNFTVVVELYELFSVPTSGTITVKITRDSKVTLTFPAGATSVGSKMVQNGAWTFSASDPSFYVLTTTQAVAAGGKLAFGLNGVLTPNATSGVLTMTSVIVAGSGGELRIDNNSDADKIDYFQK